ncbi:serine hydroxymethyltransferase [Mycoplasma marinum]|uniref:Serine hydroxymethyltransferase n=1 Tax=Mycoplasma marinum TaxID=1937190 RepID=A0A4R0XR11_9MOLU|nr:serine hydroxymethyltransferase [Mycoplasma marinum]TCG12040.1 serine hydroxymethyltransferase [Mycoplasma marinum]
MYKKIELEDKVIQEAINNEFKRQQNHIELIASENYVSDDVMKATGSVLTNKYAEGYPGKRYYDGTEFVDIVENAAIERIKKLFNVGFANVQPHSGSSANAAAIAALIKPGDTILGMSLDAGGHLTHGYKINFSGNFYNPVSYGVDDNGLIDYDEVLRIAKETKPDLIICGASAYSRTIDFSKFKEIADAVGAKLMADVAHIAGLIVAGLHPSPVEYADVITSTTHKTLRGARGGLIITNDPKVAKSINRWIFPGYQGGPLLHSIAGKAIAFGEALKPSFKKYQEQIIKNADAFANRFIELGAPVVSGGTDTHLFTVDVKKGYGITGKDASNILQGLGITINKNTVPNDTESPFVTSGIRLGTPAMTSRGLKEKDFVEITDIIHSALKDSNDQKIMESLKKRVEKLINDFPIVTKY